MTKVIRLNESDIHRIVKRVLKEQLTQTQLNSPKSKQAKKFQDRKSTRLNSSHVVISYAVFCLKKKKKNTTIHKIHSLSETN